MKELIIVKSYYLPILPSQQVEVVCRKFKKYGLRCKLYIIKEKLFCDYVEIQRIPQPTKPKIF